MKFYIVIPAHNEAIHIEKTLNSIINQTVLPAKVIVVNDHSTDETSSIVSHYCDKHNWIKLIEIYSTEDHLPGSKVIHAFNKGYEMLDTNYDIIIKLDADLILPDNYFESIISIFNSDNKIGIVGGFAYIEKNGEWILENLTDKDHVRGAFKAYRKKCFLDIGNLKPAMGWDTVDELLAQFYGWKIKTTSDLKVKHLKPTGTNYHKTAHSKQGQAFYSLRYGFLITAIASLKLAFRKKKPLLFIDYLKGFLNAKKNNIPFLVNSEQGIFIRNYRWKKMKSKLF